MPRVKSPRRAQTGPPRALLRSRAQPLLPFSHRTPIRPRSVFAEFRGRPPREVLVAGVEPQARPPVSGARLNLTWVAAGPRPPGAPPGLARPAFRGFPLRRG